jgi:cyclohexanone monooxygenase
MIVAIEQHGDWVAECIDYVRATGRAAIVPTIEAEDEWVAHVNDLANLTLFPKANSWYMGANVPGKARVFMPYLGGLNLYGERLAEVASDGYRGFELV